MATTAYKWNNENIPKAELQAVVSFDKTRHESSRSIFLTTEACPWPHARVSGPVAGVGFNMSHFWCSGVAAARVQLFASGLPLGGPCWIVTAAGVRFNQWRPLSGLADWFPAAAGVSFMLSTPQLLAGRILSGVVLPLGALYRPFLLSFGGFTLNCFPWRLTARGRNHGVENLAFHLALVVSLDTNSSEDEWLSAEMQVALLMVWR